MQSVVHTLMLFFREVQNNFSMQLLRKNPSKQETNGENRPPYKDQSLGLLCGAFFSVPQNPFNSSRNPRISQYPTCKTSP